MKKPRRPGRPRVFHLPTDSQVDALSSAFDLLASRYGWPVVMRALRAAGLNHCSRTVVTAATDAIDAFDAHGN